MWTKFLVHILYEEGSKILGKAKKIGKIIMNFLGIFIPNVTFCIIFITFMVSIISRYVFKQPVTWSYEISVLGYMWTMFFGVGKAMETDEHVVFGLIYDMLQAKGQLVFKVIYNIFLLFLIIVCFIPCVESLLGKQMMTGVLKLPYTFVFAPFIFMIAEIAVRSVINVANAYKEYKGQKEMKGEIKE